MRAIRAGVQTFKEHELGPQQSQETRQKIIDALSGYSKPKSTKLRLRDLKSGAYQEQEEVPFKTQHFPETLMQVVQETKQDDSALLLILQELQKQTELLNRLLYNKEHQQQQEQQQQQQRDVRNYKRATVVHTPFGVFGSLPEAVQGTGLPYRTVYANIARNIKGWSRA